MKNINFYIVCLVVIILNHSYTVAVYSLFYENRILIGIVGILTLISCLILYNDKLHPIPFRGYVAYFTIVGGILFSSGFNATSIIGRIITMFPILSFFMLSRKELNNVLVGIDKLFFCLVLLSLSLFVMDNIGVSLPNLGIKNIYGYYYRDYYYIYIDTLSYNGKFCGFTLEPGYFSLLLVSLLLINKFNYRKKSTFVYTAALLCTLSLGGYILGTIGFLLQRTLEYKRITKGIGVFVVLVLILLLLIVVTLNFNNGNNVIAERVLSRLAFDNELGVVGNNRENNVAEQILDQYFYSDRVWLGIGGDKLHQILNVKGVDVCSWRVFILSHGAIYTILFFIMSVLFLLCTNVRVTLPFFVVYWLDLYQHGTLYSETLYLLLIYMNANSLTRLSGKVPYAHNLIQTK